jgi:hypothetical protein
MYYSMLAIYLSHYLSHLTFYHHDQPALSLANVSRRGLEEDRREGWEGKVLRLRTA